MRKTNKIIQNTEFVVLALYILVPKSKDVVSISIPIVNLNNIMWEIILNIRSDYATNDKFTVTTMSISIVLALQLTTELLNQMILLQSTSNLLCFHIWPSTDLIFNAKKILKHFWHTRASFVTPSTMSNTRKLCNACFSVSITWIFGSNAYYKSMFLAGMTQK